MECSAIPAKLIATCFALVAFAAAMVVGLASGNDATTVIKRSLIAMGACWIVGRIVGHVAQRTVEEQIESYKLKHPIPSEDVQETPSAETTTQQEKTTT